MTEIPGWKPIYSGKVRDLYIPETAPTTSDAEKLLIVATDRISAFDHVLSPEIPGKGALLTALSTWWFSQLPDVPHHVLAEIPPAEVAGRAMVVVPLTMFPIECVVRGYLAGSGWKEYSEHKTVGGIPVPEGLHEGDQLPEVLFTPATKAAIGDHDENISFERMVKIIGDDAAHALRDISLNLYSTASAIAVKKGLILADTKFEFGTDPHTGAITLGDEVLTSDSSRYWDGDRYAGGGMNRVDSFDKQLVRDWLSAHWDGQGDPPVLPNDLVMLAQKRYGALFTRLTGITRDE